MREYEIAGMRQLFQSIIVRAAFDAFGSRTKPKSTISKIDKKDAKYFLCEEITWFPIVCEYAKKSPDRVRRVARYLNSLPEEQAVAEFRKLVRLINEKN